MRDSPGVAQIKAITARGLLDEIAQAANAAAIDLIDAIRAGKRSVYSPSFKQGRIYVSTGGSGQSASFLIPNELSSDFSPVQIANQFQKFIEIYNDCVTAGLITDASATDADAAVMMQDDRLQTVTSRLNDFTCVRFPGMGQGIS